MGHMGFIHTCVNINELPFNKGKCFIPVQIKFLNLYFPFSTKVISMLNFCAAFVKLQNVCIMYMQKLCNEIHAVGKRISVTSENMVSTF